MTERGVNALAEDLLTLLGHDLKSPAGAIQGYLSLIMEYEKDSLTEAALRHLEAIGQANRTLLLLINNAVDNTKLELGKWTEVTEPVRLRDLLADVVSALKPFGDNKAIRTELTGDGDFLLEADRRVLRAAIIDLALGSIKLSRNGGIVTIDLSIADMVRITIKDCGKPVPPEYWGRFFDREMEPYPPLKGSRQGLCVARDFLTQMGWSVAFGHAPDGGNTFTLSRPAGKEGLDEQGANK